MSTNESENYAEKLVKHMNNAPLPALGSTQRVSLVAVSEAEINSLGAAIAFVRSACQEAGLTSFWRHYGPTLEELLERLPVLE